MILIIRKILFFFGYKFLPVECKSSFIILPPSFIDNAKALNPSKYLSFDMLTFRCQKITKIRLIMSQNYLRPT